MICAGDILYVYCIFIDPPHYKYAVCICPEYPLFFFINSEPRRSTADAQILIKKSDFPFLTYDSYINTATVVTFRQRELNEAEKKGRLTSQLKKRIIDVVKNHKYLPPRHTQLVFDNLQNDD